MYSLALQVDTVDGNVNKIAQNVLPCTLDEATQKLISLIFSNDMFKEAMEHMNLGGCVSVEQSFENLQVCVGVNARKTCCVTFKIILVLKQRKYCL